MQQIVRSLEQLAYAKVHCAPERVQISRLIAEGCRPTGIAHLLPIIKQVGDS